MAITLNSPTAQSLVDILQINDAKKRYVTYLGAAETITSFLIQNALDDNSAMNIIKLNKLSDEIGELALIDKSLFVSCLRRVFEYKTDTFVNDDVVSRIGSATCVYDALGITKHFTTDDIFTINRYFDTYKQAAIVTAKAIKIEDGNLKIS